MSDLETCPWCGKQPSELSIKGIVGCRTPKCPAVGAAMTIEEWNTRTDTDRECVCNDQQKHANKYIYDFQFCGDCGGRVKVDE